jgi:transaldolase / glucose-6-phosphate isomerase
MSLNTLDFSLSKTFQIAVEKTLQDWREDGKTQKLWAKESALWTGTDEAQWLGWLSIVERQLFDLRKFDEFAAEVSTGNFTHILLLGMGGSSLCPEVLSFTFGKQDGFPELLVLDSTDPAQIRSVEAKIDISKTLFFVSSKSGSTLEPNIFQAYFYERVAEIVGKENAGSRFVAITDPHSKMQQVAEEKNFKRTFFGDSEIGGRYSALSDFGMIPLAAMGVDVAGFLKRTNEMVAACQNENAVENPGVVLGAILGTAWRKFGRDKVTIIISPKIFDLGAWLEQLIAESTGKEGKSLISVDREAIQIPKNYGNDRIFAYLKVKGDDEFDAAIETLEKSGQPVVRIVLAETANLGQEFFRWEIATAIAGSIMEINPFNQPDVEASKTVTKKLTSEYEETGSLPDEKPFFEGDGIKLFTDRRNADELNEAVGDDKTLENYITAHLNRIKRNDYFGLLAYVEMNDVHQGLLQTIRHSVLDKFHVATCLGFGPRFLHSTGQGYKGGANNGVFLQITCDDAEDLAVPNQKYTFGTVKAAQARGDFAVLAERERRVLRVHLSANVGADLAKISAVIKKLKV